MSISPLNFNGMIQNANEVSHAQAHENQKASVQQANVTVEVERKQEKISHQVNETDDGDKDYRYDREGNGRGYQGNRNKQKKDTDEELEFTSDGIVKKKPVPSFDIRI